MKWWIVMISICILAARARGTTNLVWHTDGSFISAGEGGTNPATLFQFGGGATQAFDGLIATNLTVSGGTNFPDAASGLFWWNTASNRLYCCDGTNWQALW